MLILFSSKCASTIVEVFNKLVSADITKHPVHRTDFSSRQTDIGKDTLPGEDKSEQTGSTEVGATLEKNKKLRKMGCCVTKSRLPHPMLNHHFDTITTMWYGRHLSVHGTKEVNDKFIHYQAAECSVPLFLEKYP
ncbi:hypothetical protein BDC45DRAFT_513693 [Circinella umbellata]|nr:hypothetical protein BDC45DRAFT_513693 [Circinella umbellata]